MYLAFEQKLHNLPTTNVDRTDHRTRTTARYTHKSQREWQIEYSSDESLAFDENLMHICLLALLALSYMELCAGTSSGSQVGENVEKRFSVFNGN